MTRNTKLRQICLGYLQRLRGIAEKHGLSEWLNKAIQDTNQEECVATEEEVMLLSRAVDDERITRTDVPPILGKSYRACFVEEHFEKLKKLRHVGIYGKVDTLLYANDLENNKQQNKRNYGSKRLCNCDGMDERLPHEEKEAHKERDANNE